MTTACRRGLVATGCVVLVGFFWLVRWALEQPLDGNSKAGVRRSPEYEIAGGMSVRYRHLHAESASFKSARSRRRRMGAIVLGAFKVLELEDVRLNLPLPAEMGEVAPPAERPPDNAEASSAPSLRKSRSKSRNSMDRVLEKIGLSGIGRFSGVAIKGLRVGQMTDTGAEPLFAAMKAETRGTTLQLSRCEVFRDGKKESVPEARLEWKDGLRLVWSGGSLDLPDLVEASKSEVRR